MPISLPVPPLLLPAAFVASDPGRPVVILMAGPPSDDHPWIGLAVGAIVLIAAAALAWRRAHGTAPTPSRSTRIVRAALTCGAAMAAMRAPDEIALGGGPLESAFATFVPVAMLALILLGIADLLLDAFRPHRTRTWLLLAPPLLVVFFVGTLAATGWMDMVSAEADPGEAMLVIAVLAAALTWWSHLPEPGVDVARIFE